MARKLAGVVFAVSALHSSILAALGLGEIELESSLNQPLSARIELNNVGDLNNQQIAVRLAGLRDFERAGVERVIFLSDLKFAVTLDGKGGGFVKITSEKLVREPFLDFVLEARWPEGRLLREYTVLVDLPTFSNEPAAKPAPAAVAARAGRVAPVARVAYRAPAPAPSAAALPSEVTTRRNDSLWGIAEKVKPESVTMQQAMMAIYTKNTAAFDEQNINGLRKGQVLRLPTNEEYASLTRQQAINAVAVQNDAWREAKAAPLRAGNVASTTAPAASEESYMKLAGGDAQAQAAADVVGRKDGTGAASGAVATLQNDLVATEEKLDRAERENAELDSRVDDLQEQIATLEQLIQLKDQQLASLQSELAADGANPAGVDLNFRDDQADAAAPAPVEAAMAADSLLDRVVSWPGLGLLGLLSAAGAAALAWRRRGDEDGGDPMLDDAQPASAPRASGAEALAGDTEELLAALQQHDSEAEEQTRDESWEAAESTFDPVAEAEIYCSYGRHEEAIGMLRKAIREDADRAELHIKLLSILAELERREDFLGAYAGLQATGDEDALMLVQHLVSDKGWLEDAGEALEPARGQAAAAAPASAADQTGAFDMAWESTEADDVEPLEFDLQLPDSSGQGEDADFGGALKLEGERADDGGVLQLDTSVLSDMLDQADDDDALVDLTDGDEVATKLDLARAYMDMGDEDGARDILEEVLAEGSEEHQREAGDMIRALAS
jgi:pilus assembly protein FimV